MNVVTVDTMRATVPGVAAANLLGRAGLAVLSLFSTLPCKISGHLAVPIDHSGQRFRCRDCRAHLVMQPDGKSVWREW